MVEKASISQGTLFRIRNPRYSDSEWGRVDVVVDVGDEAASRFFSSAPLLYDDEHHRYITMAGGADISDIDAIVGQITPENVLRAKLRGLEVNEYPPGHPEYDYAQEELALSQSKGERILVK